ncbi:MAG: TOBE domain-containing protein [Rhodospirillales bacterium]|nr:TOBE domain-containing protein [Rhodospirillales bacterium]
MVGIRPSAFEAVDAGADAANTITVPALVSEYIGAHSVLIADCGGTQITIDVDSETPIAVGENLAFSVEPSAIYLFDSETEVAL